MSAAKNASDVPAPAVAVPEDVPMDEDALRVGLINAQHDLRAARFHVLVVIAGDDPVGCDEVGDRLHEWMDARYLDTHAFGALSAEEQERPRFVRYFAALPRHGRIGVFLGGYAQNAVADRMTGRIRGKGLARRLEDIRCFERALVADGAVIVKLWVHLTDDEYRRRRKKARKRLREAWHVDEPDWEVFADHARAMRVAERVRRETSVDGAPWHLLDGRDRDLRDLAAARIVLRALTAGLAEPAPASAPDAQPAAPGPRARKAQRRKTAAVARVADVPRMPGGRLDLLDTSATVAPDEYDVRMEQLGERLHRLALRARHRGHAAVLVFEGPDAAGKGGVIRRITRPLSARDYRVVPIAAPTEEEKAHHYLWRFWTRLPRAGRMTIFDRSWYGRVLVERVEGYASEAQWRRAYDEIRAFERQIVDHGVRLLKFWLHVDADEQLRRFRAREHTPFKKYKISQDDYRNRARAGDYLAAAEEMFARTEAPRAPWHVISANDKPHARLRVLETLCDALDRGRSR